MEFFRKHASKSLKDATLFIMAGLFILACETWLFKSSDFLKKLEIIIRFSIPALLIICFRKYVIPRKAYIVLILYGILVFYMLAMSFFSENPDLVILNTLKYLYCLVFPISLLLILRPSSFSYSFLYIPVYLGMLFSIQTIILFILIQTGHPPQDQIVTLVGYKNMEVLGYGIWGYAHGMQAKGHAFLQVYRAQSFFGEPTVYANFLLISAIMAFGLYKTKREKVMLVAFILCAISFILAFSMTGYIVVLLTLCFSYIVKSWKRSGFLAPMIACLIIFVSIITALVYLQFATNDNFYGRSKIGMAFGHSSDEVMRRVDFMVNSIRLYVNHPFGVGVIGVEDSDILKNYPGAGGRIAPFVWVGYAGVVGLIIQLTIIFYLLNKIVVKQILVIGKIEHYIGLSFVACVLYHCVAGDWFTALFFYLVVCVIATDAYQFSFCRDWHKKRIVRVQKNLTEEGLS